VLPPQLLTSCSPKRSTATSSAAPRSWSMRGPHSEAESEVQPALLFLPQRSSRAAPSTRPPGTMSEHDARQCCSSTIARAGGGGTSRPRAPGTRPWREQGVASRGPRFPRERENTGARTSRPEACGRSAVWRAPPVETRQAGADGVEALRLDDRRVAALPLVGGVVDDLADRAADPRLAAPGGDALGVHRTAGVTERRAGPRPDPRCARRCET
jgi:hypothetical protein